jgi:CHAT domain-containing protein/tetratricopeptide (TPR) repeat protein
MISCKGRTRIPPFAAVALCGLCFTLDICALQQPAASPVPLASSGSTPSASSSSAQSQRPSPPGSPSARAITTAWELFNSGQIEQAEAAFQHILHDATVNQDSSGEAEAHVGLASIAYQRARFADARAEDERALALFDALHDRRGVARVREGLANVASWLGDLKTARNLYSQALNEFTELGLDKDRCKVLMLFAAINESYPERIRMDTEALEIARKLGSRHLQGEALHWRGTWYFHEGDSETAERDYKEAETLLDSPEDRTVRGRLLLSEGRLQRAHGALDQAIDTLSRGLKLAEETQDGDGQIMMLNARSACYGDQKKTKEALGGFLQAFELAKPTGSARLIETIRQNIAEAYINLDEPRRGAEMLEEVNRQTPDPFPYQAQFRDATLALAYLRLQEYPRAVASAAKSVAEARERKNEQFLSEPLMLKAHAEEKLGQNDLALADVREALKVIEGLRARLVPSDFLKRGFGEKTLEAFDYSVALLQAMNRPEQAIEVAEQARARAFLDLLASHQLTLHRPAAPPAVVTEKSVLAEKSLPAEKSLAEQKSVAANQTVASDGPMARSPDGAISSGSISSPISSPAAQPNATQSPTAELQQRGGTSARTARPPSSPEPELASVASASSSSLHEMQEQAARLHSTIVSYWVSDEATYVWVLNSQQGVHSARIPVKRERLADLVAGVFPSPGNTAENAPGRSKPASPLKAKVTRGGDVEFPSRGHVELKASAGQKDRWRELYRLLIEPIESYLPSPARSADVSQAASRITIIPHGPLFGLSFAGLRDAGGRYLLERYTLEYSPAISVLKFTGAMPTPPAGSPHFLLIGDPAGMQKLGLPQLPGARREVSAAARLLTPTPKPDQVTVLTGEDAQLKTIRSFAAQSSVIHFATHGILDNQQPFDSFLALSDGKLTTRDIYGLNLNSDLVFLSACRSGMGKVSGDGVLGLTRAFLYAGTRSVVATLWDVADEPTGALVASFYKNVSQGKDRAQALRAAQLSVLTQLRAGKMKVSTPRGQLTLPENPVFWGSFVLIGEP